MTLHSRLPPELTLDQRVTEINRMFEKIDVHGQQTERLRWRLAIELQDVQKRVLEAGLPWEAWCQASFGRSLRDIRRLIAMAKTHDPEAAHEAEKSAQRVASNRSAPAADIMSGVGAERSPAEARERDAGRAYAARRLIRAVLAKHPIGEVRGWLELIDINDLIEALDAEASPHRDDVTLVSTATH